MAKIDNTLPPISIGTDGVSIHNDLSGLNDGDYIHLTIIEKNKLDNLPENVSPLGHTHLEADITDLDKYTQLEVDNFLNNKFDNPTGNNTQYLDGAGVQTTFPTIPSITGLATETYVNNGLNLKVDKVTGKSLIDDTEISRLASMTAIFTTALKTAYDSAVTWVTTNGTNVLNHLTSTSNPHNVTKSQVGLPNVDDTSDLNKPISNATQTALNLKANIPKTLRATSNIVLTSTTASQKLFGNLGDNGDGSFNVEVGRYRIEILITLTNLATTNSSIGFLTGIGDGTSAFSNILIAVTAFKAGLTGSGTGILTRMTSFSSNPAITSTTTNANGFAQGLGEFSVTTAGKFYPAISLNVAKTAELNVNSYCTITKIS